MKLSQWHKGNNKPVHVGVYEVYCAGWFAWWDGAQWGWAQDTLKRAARYRKSIRASQYKPWRGIVK